MAKINPNHAMFTAQYFRSIYAEPKSHNSGLAKANRELSLPDQNDRDRAIISEEARRMQRSTKTLGTNESSFDQHRQILIPGQDQTELQPQAGLKPARATDDMLNINKELSPDPVPPQEALRKTVAKSTGPQQEAPGSISEPPKPVAEDTLNIIESQQDYRSLEANINNINRSSQLQSYATAANITQASMTVNYKV